MIPTLKTDRLILRPFHAADAPRAATLFGAKEIAATTLIVPHPFSEQDALAWIASHAARAAKGEAYIFAIALRAENELAGTAMLRVDREHRRAELSYWLGVPYWNHGYTTEAAGALIAFGFEELQLNRIWAAAMTKNPASIQVLCKAGLKYEGTFPQHVWKWGQYEDLAFFGLLRAQYQAMPTKKGKQESLACPAQGPGIMK